MKMKLLTPLIAAAVSAAALMSPPVAFAQLGQTATLTGVVTDVGGGVLPGVTVTAASDAVIGGSRTAVTDENGVYRFPALPPGTYSVKVELSGFRTTTQEVRLQLGQTITLDAKLAPGLEETIEVITAAPTVDVKSSSAQKNLTEEVLEFIPYASRFGPDAIVLAPGVNPNTLSAFGSGGESSNAYLIDGVDTSDPEGGTQWLFANYNWFQEVQVIGLGAPAEYGGFTGVASNSLIRSGSNRYTGLFETLFQNSSMIGDNISETVLAENPDLTSDKLDYVTDTTVQVGGPLNRDKMWFFTSFGYYRPKDSPSGYPPPGGAGNPGPSERTETSPRFIFKPTLRLRQADQLTGFIEYDSYTVEGAGAASNVAAEATTKQTGPEIAWNANYTRILSSSSVFDVKYSGYDGYYAREPYNGRDLMGWWDIGTDFYSVNSYYYLRADRTRHQMNASVTKYASGFAGQHNLKFGAEFERSGSKTEVGYPGGGWVLAAYGVPYYAYLGGNYLQDATNNRLSVFAQDSWAVGRKLTINPGLRIDHFRGSLKAIDGTVYKATGWGPRIGFAYDTFGNGRTVVKGHYGRYFDGAKANYYNLVNGTEPEFGAYIDPTTLQPLHEPYLRNPGTSIASVADDLKQPRLDQFIIGFEHELFPNFAVGAIGIFRDNKDFIEDILITGEFVPIETPDPGPDGVEGTADDTGRTLTFYEELSDPADDRFLITNPDDAFRRYRGLELSATKRFADSWMLQASWVISKITGNVNNTSQIGNSVEYDDPNRDPRFQPFREGRLSNDNTHIAKVLGAYRLPYGVMASAAYYYTTGATYTRLVRERLAQGSVDLFAEPRGSRRLEGRPSLDVKFEKRFNVGGGDLGVTLESFNFLNNGAVNDRLTRSGAFFDQPQGLVSPRTWRIGGVFRF
jgi:hypothetical protein